MMDEIKDAITSGECFLGIEFGSTRIKAMLILPNHTPVAQGSFDWENSFVNGVWTYSEEDIFNGLKKCYKSLKADVKAKYDIVLRKIGCIGISGMMHGYMPFDKNNRLLTPFRTWRNTITEEAAEKLTEEFDFNIPQRWSSAHLYQSVLNHESYIGEIDSINTLAGYVHFMLTGEKIVGIGEASGIFPIGLNNNYDEIMLGKLNFLLKKEGLRKNTEDIFPKIKTAGENAGYLTSLGAKLLDEDCDLEPGIPFCPPEGDAGTGMVATNSVKAGTGNVSAGTSIFSMVVLDKPLNDYYKEIDIVTTPDGSPVAMVHCNNCTNEINAYANLFRDISTYLTGNSDMNEIYNMIFSLSEKADNDCGNLTVYNYLSGEGVTNFQSGRPMLVRGENADFTLPNLLRANIYSSVSTLAIGMRILNKEKVKISSLYGHGGLFKTGNEGAKILASALNIPVVTMKTAGEGGAWGMAILAAYATHGGNMSLSDYLETKVFSNLEKKTTQPDSLYSEGFNIYLNRFEKGLDIERRAVELL